MYANGTGDHYRLARLLAGVWPSIPYTDRQILLRHWRDQQYVRQLSGLAPLDDLRPLVMLSPGWDREFAMTRPDVPTPLGRHHSAGSCGASGHSILIYEPRFARMPDLVASALVAHEVAHAFQFALGDRFCFGSEVATETDWEPHADRVASAWGHPGAAIESWRRRGRELSSAELQELVRYERGRGSPHAGGLRRPGP